MYSLIIPFHSDIDRLASTRRLLKSRDPRLGIVEILFCHNGGSLDAVELYNFASTLESDESLVHTEPAGIGAGYRIGIKSAQQPWIILSASDLPFGFSDIEQFHRVISSSPPKAIVSHIALGSKLHRDSHVHGYGIVRRSMSWAFYFVRLLFWGIHTPKDSQGTVLISRELARELEPKVTADDFFFTPMLVAIAQHRGVTVEEVPIHYSPQDSPSSVGVLRDSMLLFLRVITLSVSLMWGRGYAEPATSSNQKKER